MFSLFVYFLRETKAPSSYQNNYGFQRRYTCLGKTERKNEWKYSPILSLYSAKVVLCTIHVLKMSVFFYFWGEGGVGWFCSFYLQTSECQRGLK